MDIINDNMNTIHSCCMRYNYKCLPIDVNAEEMCLIREKLLQGVRINARCHLRCGSCSGGNPTKMRSNLDIWPYMHVCIIVDSDLTARHTQWVDETSTVVFASRKSDIFGNFVPQLINSKVNFFRVLVWKIYYFRKCLLFGKFNCNLISIPHISITLVLGDILHSKQRILERRLKPRLSSQEKCRHTHQTSPIQVLRMARTVKQATASGNKK